MKFLFKSFNVIHEHSEFEFTFVRDAANKAEDIIDSLRLLLNEDGPNVLDKWIVEERIANVAVILTKDIVTTVLNVLCCFVIECSRLIVEYHFFQRQFRSKHQQQHLLAPQCHELQWYVPFDHAFPDLVFPFGPENLVVVNVFKVLQHFVLNVLPEAPEQGFEQTIAFDFALNKVSDIF